VSSRARSSSREKLRSNAARIEHCRHGASSTPTFGFGPSSDHRGAAGLDSNPNRVECDTPPSLLRPTRTAPHPIFCAGDGVPSRRLTVVSPGNRRPSGVPPPITAGLASPQSLSARDSECGVSSAGWVANDPVNPSAQVYRGGRQAKALALVPTTRRDLLFGRLRAGNPPTKQQPSGESTVCLTTMATTGPSRAFAQAERGSPPPGEA
jgi:hypothetical protein